MRAIRAGDARGMPLALLLDHGELELLPGVQRAEAVRVNDGVMHEHVSKHRLRVSLQGHTIYAHARLIDKLSRVNKLSLTKK